MAVHIRKDGRAIVYYRNPRTKKTVHEYFGRGSAAEAAAHRRNAELGYGEKRRRHLNEPTFATLARAYFQGKPFNRNSRKHLGIRLKANIMPVFGKRIATRLTDQDLTDYILLRRKSGVKDSTISRELTDVMAILNYAVAVKPPMIAFNPVHGFKRLREDNAVILPPSMLETRAIIAKAANSPHLLRFIVLAHYLGVRPGRIEILSMTWPQVDLFNRTITIVSADKGAQARSRIVPIQKNLKPYLIRWYREDGGAGHLIRYRGNPVKSIKRAWKTTLLRAGITRRLRPYDLRHSFVTKCLEEGADIKALAEIVGSRPETLMRYYQHVTREVHRQTVAKMPALDEPD